MASINSLPRFPSYVGTTANGIQTRPYGEYDGARITYVRIDGGKCERHVLVSRLLPESLPGAHGDVQPGDKRKHDDRRPYDRKAQSSTAMASNVHWPTSRLTHLLWCSQCRTACKVSSRVSPGPLMARPRALCLLPATSTMLTTCRTILTKLRPCQLNYCRRRSGRTKSGTLRVWSRSSLMAKIRASHRQ